MITAMKRPRRLSFGSALDLAMLYAGKTSGILVAFVFLPLYSRELGSAQFGIVAVILAMQALLTMLDLGMSVLVGRELALKDGDAASKYNLIKTAAFALTVSYLFLLVLVSMLKLFGVLSTVGVVTTVLAVVLFWVLVLQNLYYNGIIALRAYTPASVLQTCGNISRAVTTTIAIKYVSSTIEAFLLAQLVCSVVHLMLTRQLLNRRLLIGADHLDMRSPTLNGAWELVKKGKSLAFFSLAGAAVTQLDKPIISAMISPASLVPYFLATTVCMVPISVLAAPVSQYFQPRVLNSIGGGDSVKALIVVRNFTYVLLAIVLIPSAAFFVLRERFVHLWLGGNDHVTLIRYIAILLPGYAIGALGFIPYNILVAVKDFNFQARLSLVLTLVTLVLTAVIAFKQDVLGICLVYASYNAVSTFASWGRAIFLRSTRKFARVSFLIAGVPILIVAIALFLAGLY
jgi:O-antigen/teichoic acid export membrane protein